MSDPVTHQQTDENSDQSSQMALATQTMIQQTLKLKAHTREQLIACQAALESHERTRHVLNTRQDTLKEES